MEGSEGGREYGETKGNVKADGSENKSEADTIHASVAPLLHHNHGNVC